MMKHLLTKMGTIYVIVCTGIVMAMGIPMWVVYPNGQMPSAVLRQIMLMAFLSALSPVVFLSRRELSRRAMGLRVLLHILYILLVVTGLAVYWEWVDVHSPGQIALFLLEVVAIYCVAMVFTTVRDRREADTINRQLQRRQ